jgi:hypothetical protein
MDAVAVVKRRMEFGLRHRSEISDDVLPLWTCPIQPAKDDLSSGVARGRRVSGRFAASSATVL